MPGAACWWSFHLARAQATVMYGRIALAILLPWCVGCTADSRSVPSEPVAEGSGVVVESGAPLGAHPARPRSFANIPDGGDLVVYPARRVVRKDGAYTWHRANLSEQHALRAIGGVMSVTTPTGRTLLFQYERHVEDPLRRLDMGRSRQRWTDGG